MANKSRILRFAAAIVWLLLTSTLIVWWMRFALNLISRFNEDSSRFRSMLLWEGATLLGLLIAGGGTLIYFINLEARQAGRLTEFLARFSHDVKTALAGVRLQAESLKVDNRDPELNILIDRLSTDTSRLQNQVENSLFVGGAQSRDLYSERVDLAQLIEILRDSWPRLKISLQGQGTLRADRRAIESILNNLFHNAIVHGEATEVKIEISKSVNSDDVVSIQISDNGRGYQGDKNRLGEIFYRPTAQSGSGLGLYTVKSYVQKQGGKIKFLDSEKGFSVVIETPAYPKSGEAI